MKSFGTYNKLPAIIIRRNLSAALAEIVGAISSSGSSLINNATSGKPISTNCKIPAVKLSASFSSEIFLLVKNDITLISFIGLNKAKYSHRGLF